VHGKELKALRARLGLSQTQFSKAYHIPVQTLRGWEQGMREPRGSAALLLHLIKEEPELIAGLLSKFTK
jgi:putative transcriptional regulator